MDDEKLMELVEANDIIYNKGHRYNHSFERKKRVWAKIAAEMDLPADELAKRYRTLRDRFVRYKRVEMLTGSENKYRPPIMDKMEFLTPHVFVKSSNGEKITWTLKEEDNSSNQIISSAMTPEQEHEESDAFIEMAYSSPERTLYKSVIKRKAPTYSTTTPMASCDSPAVTMPSNTDAADEAFHDALQSFKKLCKAREERQENEALHGFGQMIVATIAGMSSSKQTKAMMRVTELVMRIRMEEDD
ncbi:uncharacterized protein LOC106090776 [Stomoxys calcitrans]|uniref:uncharacterized protein LOC106090776 n=1 Tax=Stomoxys calcitrans TaxID=35570 RepID=UPI0027E28954|nr:uncharacterized protein LOC106090776 [Stomoxys calcitrans]